MTHVERAQQYFAEELAYIQSPDIRAFVLSVFEKFGHEFFWLRPASLTGKYHPQVSLGQAGLVRHVKLGCYWGREFNRALLMGAKDKGNGKYGDVIQAALILHDLMKEGDPKKAGDPERMGNGGRTLITGCHGVDLANAIWTELLGGKGTDWQILICYGIACHMGIWTLPNDYIPQSIPGDLARSIATVVHLADYAASRKVDDFTEALWKVLPMVPAAA